MSLGGRWHSATSGLWTGVSGREFRLPPFRKERGKDGAPGNS
jgi:hypothetical protein